MGPSYVDVSMLDFDRKTDSLRFSYVSRDGKIGLIPERNIDLAGKISFVGDKVITVSSTWVIAVDGIVEPGEIIASDLEDITIISSDLGVKAISPESEYLIPGMTRRAETITKAKNSNIYAWSEKDESGNYTIYKNGEIVGERVRSVDEISLSGNGYDITTMVTTLAGERLIQKNGTGTDRVRDGYIAGTFVSNGSNSLYVVATDGIKKIVMDGKALANNDFDEVREIFIQEDGNSYTFFARPVGDVRYCLFTRYRGNLCGLEWYMNPRMWADGNTVIYGWLRENKWSIYRNTTAIIEDTGYTRRDIYNDYLFYDITNPRQYLFIEKNSDGSYSFLKNGNRIPGKWKDVGLDTTFGYDNKVIMSVEDQDGWRVIEF
jgi:hypothetical protein